MVKGLLGKKVGMTQIFDDRGEMVPVTVVEVGPCTVQEIKTAEKNGYNAVQLGYHTAKEKNVNKPQREDLKKKNLSPKKFVKEIRSEEDPDVKIGDEITVDLFQEGDFIDIEGISKGKGFQGGMKRCGWSGGVDTHGSMSHRAPGSIGASSFPSKVDKGHPGPGHMGSNKVTVQNLEVVDINDENNTLLVKGAVPGANGSYIIVKFAKKKPITPRQEKENKQEEEPEGQEEEVIREETKDIPEKKVVKEAAAPDASDVPAKKEYAGESEKDPQTVKEQKQGSEDKKTEEKEEVKDEKQGTE